MRIRGSTAFLVLLLALPAAAQNVYRTVDEHGNVVFTDRQPHEGAEPMELPELSVIEAPALPQAPAAEDAPVRSERPPEIEFAVVSPSEEETIWNTAMRLPVQLSLGVELPPGAMLVIYLDDQVAARTRDTTVMLEGVERGTHTVRAELQTGTGRVLARTAPVTFFMRQQSALHPRPG